MESTKIKQTLHDTKSVALEAIDHGKETLENLEIQDAVLNSSLDTLEANEHLLNKAMTTLRGMTWSGYLYNSYSSTKEFVAGNYVPNVVERKKDSQNDCTTGSVYRPTIKQTNNLLFPPTTNLSEEDATLNQISSAVTTLHQMGLEIGNQIDLQQSALNNIATKTEEITDQTLAVTIRSSQLNDRTHKRKPRYFGTYQFVDTTTGNFLSVQGTSLVLSSAASRGTIFNIYTKEESLYGIQSEKTQKYLGCNLWGNIIVNSDNLGTQEECYININNECTGILFTARNWGAGGWLKIISNTDNTKGVVKDNEYEENSVIISETTASITDRINILTFMLYKITQIVK